ncbi:MAG: hypothetical protein EOM20_10485 [Spartobacteria bacterium]|nr:hypothetical protein [Spartobacteria bacterium]
MAATVDNRPAGDSIPYRDAQNVPAAWNVDFSEDGNDLDQNETMAIANLPAGTIVRGACIKVNTAQADVTDIDVGYSTDGSTNAGLVDGATLATTGFKAGVTANFPVLITAASQLVITNKDTDALDEADIDVILDICLGNEA